MLITIGLGLLLSFYAYYESIAKQLEATRELDALAANAVKHAYAAGEVYSLLTTLGINHVTAETITLHLGYANEHAELAIRSAKTRDTTLEMMKDLHNNQAGITTARWRRAHPAQSTALAQLIALSKNQMLVNRAETITLPADLTHLRDYRSADPTAAIAWFKSNQPAIIAETETGLKKTK